MSITTQQIPDIELVISSYLRDSQEIIDLDARVGGTLPKSFTKPWVRVSMLDATNAGSEVEHLISFLVQFDAYAGSDSQNGQGQAAQLGRTVRALLMAAQGKILDGVVISGVEIRSHARIPDLDWSPPRERMSITAEIWAHE